MQNQYVKHQNLKDRTQQFALNVVRFVETLPASETCRILGRQLLRSATSVRANYRAVCRARSKNDFIAKMGIVLEEADESAYWIELLIAANKAKPSQSAELLHEANELVAIATASIMTARRNDEER
jgi:four helix bundle protein